MAYNARAEGRWGFGGEGVGGRVSMAGRGKEGLAVMTA